MKNNTILKRLGYILEASALLDRYGNLFRRFSPSKGYPAFDPLSPKKGKFNSRWGLLINLEINPRRWTY
jgi:predicted transcriptional regulator of viral defense system